MRSKIDDPTGWWQPLKKVSLSNMSSKRPLPYRDSADIEADTRLLRVQGPAFELNIQQVHMDVVLRY